MNKKMTYMKTFRVYYEDGNQKLFDAPSKKDIREYCLDHLEETGPVRKIEEVTE